MNETIHPDGAPVVQRPSNDHQLRSPETSMLPGSEVATPAVVGLMNRAVQGAHATIDRLADSATPAAQHLGERVSAAGDALHAKTDQLRSARDEWVEGVRTTVRGNPLACLAAAVALGGLIARITRRSDGNQRVAMNAVSMLMAALVILPPVSLVAWAWFAMAKIDEELRSFTGFDRAPLRHLTPHHSPQARGETCPTPG